MAQMIMIVKKYWKMILAMKKILLIKMKKRMKMWKIVMIPMMTQ